jgi:long-chain acyl-CoA synthetase
MSVRHATAVEIFQNRARESGAQIAFRQRTDDGWNDITWSQVARQVEDTAAGLLQLGLEKADRACILTEACSEAIAADLGVLSAGGIGVPIYGSHTRAGIEYVLGDSRPRVVFIEDPVQLKKLLNPESRAKLKPVERIVLLRDRVSLAHPDEQGRRVVSLADLDTANLPLVTWAELCARGRSWTQEHPGALAARVAEIKGSDGFRIIYTSGTTGTSKGAVLTHDNIATECALMADALPLRPDDDQLFVVPLARVLGMAVQWLALQVGCRTAFGTPHTVREDLQQIKPTFLGQGPFFYQAFFNEAAAEAERAGADGKAQFEWALEVGRRYSDAVMAGQAPNAELARDYQRANDVVFSKVTERFGGRLRFTLSGGLPLSRELSSFMHAAGCIIYEGYGMSEMSSFTHVNRPGACRFGSSGQLLDTLEHKLAEDGELLVRGGVIMTGYFDKPSATEAVIDPDGFFHTGDVGRLDEDGYFYFIDRKENLIRLASGRIIPPQQIEVPLKANDIFSQVVLFGEGRPHLVALITLSERNLFAWARERGLEVTTYSKMTKLPVVTEFVQRMVDRLNERLEQDHRIRAFAILPQDLRSETGELTLTMKPRRKFLAQIHRSVIESLYTH